MEKSSETMQKAQEIAVENLRACYSEGKILASLKNFSDYWARDTFWALPGVLAVGDCDVARTSLEYFLSYQRADGKIPRKVALDYNGWKYLTGKSRLRKKPRPIYSGNLPPFSSMDANALFVIALADYVRRTDDRKFAQKNYHQVAAAIDWYQKHLDGGFVREYALGNWMDTVFKNGAVLYTNVLYAQALEEFAHIAQALGESLDEEVYKQKHKKIVEKIRAEFWNRSFFDDELGKHTHFDLAGNVLACYFGIASQQQTEAVAQKIQKIRKEKALLPTVVPKYPWWNINLVTYLLGMSDYHNGISWSWIDMFAAGMLFKNGFKKEALEMFENVCRIIVDNGAVHETYFNDGTPYAARHWASAVPFAWGSGVFLKIYAEMFADRGE